MNTLLKLFLLSALPVTEQRATIPLGIIAYNMNPILTMVICFLGNMLPVPFILYLFNSIFTWMKKYKIFKGINNIIDNKINKNSHKFEKYKELALIIFIAIPLPTTGVWTGTAIAAFLNLNKKKSFFCAIIGGILSAVTVTILSVFIPGVLGY